jgi:hypothetical protein
MKILTKALTGVALDWMVAKCEGKLNECEIHAGNVMYGSVSDGFILYNPSKNWAQAGPIIEMAKIGLLPNGNAYFEHDGDTFYSYGSNILVSAMRCYVELNHGYAVELEMDLE